MFPKISIVIPIYNAEKYLIRCLDSIVTQSFSDWECVLVDDGSSDKSGDICDAYAKKDSRFVAIHQLNGGVSAARKNGVEHSRGKWIFFSDADDEIPQKSLENLLLHDDGDVEFIAGTMHKLGDEVYITQGVNGKIHKEQYIKLLLDHTTYFGPCAKLIKRSLFNGIEWIDRRVTQNEDLFMLISVTSKINTKVYVANESVNYVQIPREGSVSKSIMPYETWRLLFDKIKEVLESYGIFNSSVDIETAYYNYIAFSIGYYITYLTDEMIFPKEYIDKLNILDSEGRIYAYNKKNLFRFNHVWRARIRRKARKILSKLGLLHNNQQ